MTDPHLPPDVPQDVRRVRRCRRALSCPAPTPPATTPSASASSAAAAAAPAPPSEALQADPNVKLVAMCDAFEDRLDEQPREPQERSRTSPAKVDVPPDRCFAGFDGYKKVIDCGVDVVLLCTPPGFRPLHLQAAVEAGKHVFCEKPVAVDAPGVAVGDRDARSWRRRRTSASAPGSATATTTAKRETVKRIHDGDDRRRDGDARQLPHRPALAPRRRTPKWTTMEYQMRNWYYFTWLSRRLHRRAALPQLRQGELGAQGRRCRSPPPASAAGRCGPTRSTATSTTTSPCTLEYAERGEAVHRLPADGRLPRRRERPRHRHEGARPS